MDGDGAAAVLDFWFPAGLDRDLPTHRAAIMRWFRGGTADDIRERFVPTWEAAVRGDCDAWTSTPRGRLALIACSNQFSRSLFVDARAYAQDPRAQQLAIEGLDRDEHRGLPVWEQIFFVLPLGHSEDLALQDRSVALAESLIPIKRRRPCARSTRCRPGKRAHTAT